MKIMVLALMKLCLLGFPLGKENDIIKIIFIEGRYLS